MPTQLWFRWPTYPLALFIGTTLAVLAALGWVGWEVTNVDPETQKARARNQREASASRIADTLRAQVTYLEERLTGLMAVPSKDLDGVAGAFSSTLGQDAVLAIFESDHVRAYPPRRLLYYPALPAAVDPDPQQFAAGDVYEHQLSDHDRAIQEFRTLTTAADAGTRGAALLRIATSHRRAGRADAALAAYLELEQLGDVWIGPGPADLVARRARCTLLEERQRSADLATHARSLAADLNAGHWKLTAERYQYYSNAVAGWLSAMDAIEVQPRPEIRSLTEVVATLWNHWSESRTVPNASSGLTDAESNGQSLLVLSRGTAERSIVLVAGPGFLENQIIASVRDEMTRERLGIALVDEDNGDRLVVSYGMTDVPPNAEVTNRRKVETRLPWLMRIVSVGPAPESPDTSLQRRLVVVALALLAVFAIVASYFTARGLSRELEAARLQSDFVAAVSHEFRTPLTLLRQFSDLLVEGRVSNEEDRQKYYGAIRRGTRRLTRLVEDLLDFGRMEAGSHKFRLAPFAAKPWIERLVTEFQDEIRSQGYEVQLSWTGGDGVYVRADEAALGRAVWNLLDNAAKYSPQSKTIWVDASAESHQLTISVKDRGLGVPVNEQQIIFRKFVRGQTVDAHVVKGTGLGLALVEQIVTAHGGRVLLDSQVGEGSRFSIVIPREA